MDDVLLDVSGLTHRFRLTKKVYINAVDSVSFHINRGEIFGLVGESGSGKSTLARCIMGIHQPSGGSILYNGVDICNKEQCRIHRKMLQRTRQLIFQDSASSLNQRMKVMDIISEPMRLNSIAPTRGSMRAEAEFHLKSVGLDAFYLDKYPPELSGGMRQRVAIARALSVNPELVVADEPIASLDVSIQAQIINLFKELQREQRFTFLFIAHDLSVVKYLCDRVGVMYQGKIVEIAPSEELFCNPMHPYTRFLISAIPVPDPIMRKKERSMTMEPESIDLSGTLREVCPNHFVLWGEEKI